MGLVYGNAILILFVIIELMYIHFSRKETIDFKEVTANINSGQILLFIFRSLSLAVYFFVWENFKTGFVLLLPSWVSWFLVFLLWDFCYYWSHRLHHYFSALWVVHQVHHEGEHFNLSLGLRNSWYSTITSMPFFLVLAVLGFPLEVFVTVSGIHYFIQFLNHSNLVRKIPVVEKVFITPGDHRVHHGKNEPYLHKNFGGTFVIWDKMFKTFQAEKPGMTVEYGISGRIDSANALLINNPFLYSRYLKAGQNLGTGSGFTVPVYLIVSGCLLLLGLLLCYLYKAPFISGTEKLFLFTLIFSGTIANGGLSDKKRWGALLWIFSGFILSVIYLLVFPEIMWIQIILLMLMMMHALIVWLLFLRSG